MWAESAFTTGIILIASGRVPNTVSTLFRRIFLSDLTIIVYAFLDGVAPECDLAEACTTCQAFAGTAWAAVLWRKLRVLARVRLSSRFSPFPTFSGVQSINFRGFVMSGRGGASSPDGMLS